MKKYIVPSVLIILSVAVVYMFFAYKPGVKQPINYYQTFPTVQPVVERLVTTPQADYATNLVVSNLLQLPVTTPSYTLGLWKRPGQIYFDAVNSELRFQLGNYTGGEVIPLGKFMVDSLVFTSGTDDTLTFPDLNSIGRVVTFDITADTLSGDTATVNILSKSDYKNDTVFVTTSSTVFPLTLDQKDCHKIFTADAVAQKNQAIVDFDGSAAGQTVIIRRKVWILDKYQLIP